MRCFNSVKLCFFSLILQREMFYNIACGVGVSSAEYILWSFGAEEPLLVFLVYLKKASPKLPIGNVRSLVLNIVAQ